MVTFKATFSESNNFNATFLENGRVVADFGEVQYIRVGDWYDGEYEATPSENEQTLLTAGKVLAQDIVIQPIPSNYGLITWNGSTLTVS